MDRAGHTSQHGEQEALRAAGAAAGTSTRILYALIAARVDPGGSGVTPRTYCEGCGHGKPFECSWC